MTHVPEPAPPRRRWRRLAGAAAVVLTTATVVVFAGAMRYRLTATEFVHQAARRVATPVYSWLYRGDLTELDRLASAYYVGDATLAAQSSHAAWAALGERTPGLRVTSTDRNTDRLPDIPFIYERADTPRLTELVRTYGLDAVAAGPDTEYESMLRLASWLGTRWDHGTSPVEGTSKVCEPVEVIRAGERGARYWCEIAARTTVHAAAALNWPARVVTASSDGYTWEHAVAEFWSNQFSKWFVVDTDFNLVYEEDGVPLSALELSSRGLALQGQGRLAPRRFALAKPSLVDMDLLPLYKYVHVDMRTDWCDRPLQRGSPAGGDRATWWTARPTLGPVLSGRVRVDDPSRFDWPVNVVALHPARASAGTTLQLTVRLAGYSPVFERFEIAVDDSAWQPAMAADVTTDLAPGPHVIRARIRTRGGQYGPVSEVALEFRPGR